jgi:hypothetical protein
MQVVQQHTHEILSQGLGVQKEVHNVQLGVQDIQWGVQEVQLSLNVSAISKVPQLNHFAAR